MPRWTLTCSPWVRGPGGDCVTCCLLEKAEMEWGIPPLAGPLGRRRFFHRFSAHFCVTLEHLVFKRQNVEEQSAQKSAPKSAHQKSAQKSAHKKSAQKWVQKSAQKSAHQKSALKKTVWTFRFLEDGSQQKKAKKICAKFVQNPSPNCKPFDPAENFLQAWTRL